MDIDLILFDAVIINCDYILDEIIKTYLDSTNTQICLLFKICTLYKNAQWFPSN